MPLIVFIHGLGGQVTLRNALLFFYISSSVNLLFGIHLLQGVTMEMSNRVFFTYRAYFSN